MNPNTFDTIDMIIKIAIVVLLTIAVLFMIHLRVDYDNQMAQIIKHSTDSSQVSAPSCTRSR